MYIGAHSNSYLASLGIQRGQALTQIGVSRAGTGVFSSSAKVSSTASSNSSATYLTSLKTGATQLKQSLKSLTSGTAFTQKSAVSSDTDAMSVVQSQASKYAASAKDVTVKIDRVATAQENTGTALSSTEKLGDGGNSYAFMQFQIEVGGKTHQFSLTAAAGETNKSLQDRMAKAINDAGIGVTAEVSSKDGKSILSLKSKETGDSSANVFKISDVSGNAVSRTGAANTTTEAQDALYSVNGSYKTSKTNIVDLGNGITATLKKAVSSDITVSQGVDKKAAITEVQKLVDSYNKLFSAAFSNDIDSKANNLLLDLNNISRTYLSSLSQVGLGFDSNGNMTINQSIMEKAAEDGTLSRFLSDGASRNYGFASQLEKVASNIENNIGKYAGAESFTEAYSGLTGSSNSSDAAMYKSIFASQGLTGGWNMKNLYVGVLFNSMF